MRRCLARLGRLAVVDQFDGRRGAVLFFARVMGREVVEKLTGKTVLDVWTAFSLATANTPSWYVGYCFCPFRSNQLCCRFDFNTFSPFFIATGLGQLPATIVYSWAAAC